MYCSSLTKKLFATVLSLLLIFCTLFSATSAKAQNVDKVLPEIPSQPYAYILDTNVTILISGISANCRVVLRTAKSYPLKIKMELQKKKSDGYSTVETWTTSDTDTSLTLTKKRNINVLCSYRLKATVSANGETKTYYAYP